MVGVMQSAFLDLRYVLCRIARILMYPLPYICVYSIFVFMLFKSANSHFAMESVNYRQSLFTSHWVHRHYQFHNSHH